jgi:hypothetical protein
MSIRSYPELRSALSADRAALVEHSLYARLTGLRDVRVFMEHHVSKRSSGAHRAARARRTAVRDAPLPRIPPTHRT